MEEAGRRHCRIPAFGDWNYRYDGGDGDGDWPVTPCFNAAMWTPLPAHNSMPKKRTRPRGRRRRVPAFGEWNHRSDDDGSLPVAVTPFVDLAAARKPPKTESRDGDAGKQRTAEPHGRRRSKVADSEAYAGRTSCFTVAKAVDDDLYGVPPDMLYQKPSRKGGWLRILLMWCFCPRGLRSDRP